MLSMSIQLMQEEIVGKIGYLLKSLGIGRTEDEEFMKVKDVIKQDLNPNCSVTHFFLFI